MLQKIKKLLGLTTKLDYTQLKKDGLTVIDVRTVAEYNQGHCNGSINLPLDQINSIGKKVKNKDTPIVTCCASGMRSAAAKRSIKNKGFQKVYNGGSWQKVANRLKTA